MKTFRAFTMIELIFIIVVVGILAAVAIPRVERNGLIEAADQLASHIRYTQQLAMGDNKFSATDPNWHLKGWRIKFTGTTYEIFDGSITGNNIGEINRVGGTVTSEFAVDPMNPQKFLTPNAPATTAEQNKKLNLANTYSITNIALGGACANLPEANRAILFDVKGRPMSYHGTLYGGLFTTVCTITLTNEAGQTATIFVQPETGYVGADANNTATLKFTGDIRYTGI